MRSCMWKWADRALLQLCYANPWHSSLKKDAVAAVMGSSLFGSCHEMGRAACSMGIVHEIENG